jgi:putative DNA modification/repair radical SAM protein
MNIDRTPDDPLIAKLEILADAAKYDASCASSGGKPRNALGGGIGSVTGSGICHAYTPDGRCISLLKILLTNFCIYDCLYCVSRRSSNVKRARFTVDEVVRLTLGLYRRNCIEGLFLSSGIARSEDDTMADMVRVAKALREEHGFKGYIHLKTIPGASDELLREAGRYADRLSMNVELPSERSLNALAPEKSSGRIKRGMAATRAMIDDASEPARRARPRRFAPAGQSTQMIVGADESSDLDIMRTSTALYASYALKRVYFAAFSPTGHPSSTLPSKPAPLIREHRLYQSDWLLRHYGFNLEELAAGMTGGMLDLTLDPKLAWALAHRGLFPLDVNAAPREMLLRVPGLGVRAIDRLISARRHTRLRYGDIAKLTGALRRARAFIATDDHRPTAELDSAALASRLTPQPDQLSLF